MSFVYLYLRDDNGRRVILNTNKTIDKKSVPKSHISKIVGADFFSYFIGVLY